MRDYSGHAQRRMAQRGITKEDVEFALSRTVGGPLPGDNGNVVHCGIGTKGRRLRVVLASDGVVVSAFWEE